ncbi:MAG: DUF4258 domain-containing protein [Nitrospirota bacterium]|nr:DUF4258 domain-containing protein [Nitrospirota bacterium]
MTVQAIVPSDHARERMRQRGIRPEDLVVLFEHGAWFRQSNGEVVYFDRSGKQRLRQMGLERLAWLYAILSPEGETVITVGWRRGNKMHLH